MDENLTNQRTETEKTRPPVSALRYTSPFELYAEMPALTEMTHLRPREDESSMSFSTRLQASATPEAAITFAAFAARPKMAIWWGYECLRTLPEWLEKGDREMLEMVASWTADSQTPLRYRTMKRALFSEIRTPAVLLGLAVGWSSGPIAPCDPAPVSPNRTPRAINSAVLSCLAKAGLSQRSANLAKFIKLSESLFQVY